MSNGKKEIPFTDALTEIRAELDKQIPNREVLFFQATLDLIQTLYREVVDIQEQLADEGELPSTAMSGLADALDIAVARAVANDEKTIEIGVDIATRYANKCRAYAQLEAAREAAE